MSLLKPSWTWVIILSGITVAFLVFPVAAFWLQSPYVRGVQVNVVAGCVAKRDLASYVEEYDEVSCRLLNAKRGRDIFEECSTLAIQKYRAEHPNPDAEP